MALVLCESRRHQMTVPLSGENEMTHRFCPSTNVKVAFKIIGPRPYVLPVSHLCSIIIEFCVNVPETRLG